MQTLKQAWEWYQAASEGMKRLRHLATYWGQFPWGTGADWVAEVEKDNILRHVGSEELANDADAVDQPLADLAVLVLFSVFEAIVRDQVTQQIRPEIDLLQHAALKNAGEDVLQAVAEGSFFRVLEPFKSAATSDLIEQVNQVRRYRNWVAHGRRAEKKPDVVRPKEAYERLKLFLAAIQPPGASPT